MHKKRVMIVDDEYTIRELIALILEDYDTIKASSAKEAFEKMQLSPDLVILDVMMPLVDGYHVCKELKSKEETKHIPIIMLTAKHQADDVRIAIEAGADEYITKPFEPEVLKKRVDAYLKDNKMMERKIIQNGKSIHYIKGSEPQTRLDQIK